MAKNLFEQLISKAGEIWSGPSTHSGHSVYVEESSSNLSGVAKYLAKQEKTEAPKEEAGAAPLSGVEKYLARQQASAATEAPKTGVEKYLARKTTGSTSAVKEPVPVAIPKTGVAKYLAGVPLATEAKSEPKAPQAKPEKSKSTAPAKKKPAPAQVTDSVSAPASNAAAAAPKKAAAAKASNVIRFENVAQCQSRTVKGTQCKNTNNLTALQQTINNQTYEFSACLQHNNDSFKPYAPLLETH